MSYYFSKVLSLDFNAAVTEVTRKLKDEGFGVITDIDVKATLKSKIGVEFRPYRILGACNPALAYEALKLDDKVGTMLPCNVIIQEIAPDQVEVAAIDPVWRQWLPSTIRRCLRRQRLLATSWPR